MAERPLHLDIEEVERRRAALGLTMEEAAKAGGLGKRQAWSNIVNGGRADVSISTLGKIAKALGCDPADLLK